MSHIICVHSFRHGTGKSSLTANLAVCLAAQGQRVGIIDTDFQAPGIHSLFDLDPDHLDPALNYYLWNHTASLEETAQLTDLFFQVGEGAIIVMGGGIYLVPDSLKLSEMTRLLNQGYDVTRLQQGILELSERLNLDILLIDSHPAWDEGALATVGMVDIAIVLMCLDRQDFQGTAVALDVMAKLEVPHTLLVVNQVLSSYDRRTIREQLMTTYNIAEITLLPLSLKMALLGGHGIFCLKYPQDELTQKIEALAQRVIALAQQTPPKFQRLPFTAAEPPSAAPVRSVEESGIRMLDLLEMPHEQRQLMRWLIRHDPVSFSTIAAHAAQTWQQSDTQVQALLDSLIQQQYVRTRMDGTGQVYEVNWVSQRKRSGGMTQIWSSLEPG